MISGGAGTCNACNTVVALEGSRENGQNRIEVKVTSRMGGFSDHLKTDSRGRRRS